MKLGLRKLIRLGIQGKGSGPNGEITEADVRRVFSGKIFSVKSRETGIQENNIPILTENGIHGLWDYHFSKVSFNEKLNKLNDKIGDYRNELSATGNHKLAYMTLFDKYPIAKLTNLYNAVVFINKLGAAGLMNEDIRGIYPLKNFMGLYEVLLASIIFAP